jgi:hypothetical protein
MRAVGTLPALLQGFFTKRLMSQRQASPHTISAYRDTFRLLLLFAETHTGKPPSRLLLSDLNGRLVADFLDDLERLVAIRPGAAMRGSPRFAPSFTMLPTRNLAPPLISSMCCPFRESAIRARSFRFLAGRKSKPC